MTLPSVLTSAVTSPNTRSFGYGATAVCGHVAPLADVVGNAQGQILRHFDLQRHDLERRRYRTDGVERLLAGHAGAAQRFAEGEAKLGFDGRVDDVGVVEAVAAGVGVAFQQEAEGRVAGIE